MRSFYRPVLLLIAVFVISTAIAQKQFQPFYDEIQAIKKQDSISFPPKGAILFIGSSSLKKWTNMADMLKGYTVINRGFGGSSFPDLMTYADDIIFPYQPKQIVIYCGDNDIATDTVDSRMVADRFKSLFRLIRDRLPGIPVVFISIKPSPSREKYMPVMKQANQLIYNFLWQQRNAGYVDVYNLMLNSAGKPRPELFLEDMLHMNQEGYAIWRQALLPYLLKN